MSQFDCCHFTALCLSFTVTAAASNCSLTAVRVACDMVAVYFRCNMTACYMTTVTAAEMGRGYKDASVPGCQSVRPSVRPSVSLSKRKE